jgi:hypothetical protein
VAVLISYVDDGTIIVQSDTWDKNLVKLKSAYKIVFEWTQSMGLVLEHNTVTVTLTSTLAMPLHWDYPPPPRNHLAVPGILL